MMVAKPSLNGGTTTRPLTAFSLEVLVRLRTKGPVPCSVVNPGVVDALTRRDMAEIRWLPSPYKTHKGKPIAYLSTLPKRVVRQRAAAPEEVRRAGGEAVCPACNQSYREHTQYTFTDNPDTDDFAIILVRDCAGNFWKL